MPSANGGATFAFNCGFSRQRRFKVALGSAEIRVLNQQNTSIIGNAFAGKEPTLVPEKGLSLGTFDVSAAPNLIYH